MFYNTVHCRLYGEEDELSAGLEEALDRGTEGGGVEVSSTDSDVTGATLTKRSPLSTTLTNLAVDAMDVDDDYGDYADSDDYHY